MIVSGKREFLSDITTSAVLETSESTSALTLTIRLPSIRRIAL